MKFVMITHVSHGNDGRYFAYGPFVREMNIWMKYIDKVAIVAPFDSGLKNNIDLDYEHSDIEFKVVRGFNFTSAANLVKSVFIIPSLLITVFSAMRKADHIHLRCPGNMGLLGCFGQIFFPEKKKTAKYAGNWDMKSRQPLSYRLQKWILNNTFLTRNMTVLVYGKWEGSSRNIKPFFTATYKEADKTPVVPRVLSGAIKFLFVGTLAAGKRPLYAIQMIERLRKSGVDATLDLFGEGSERPTLEKYIIENNLQGIIALKGNQNEQTVRQAYQSSHFILLPSESEGWPKVVAEAMFWGCFPIASAVSCVPFMLDYGNRGLLLNIQIEKDTQKILAVLKDQPSYNAKVAESISWSRQFTLDLFETEIKALLGK
ncbi:MAG TPA: glycosyltransferase [Flavobacterium sp.]|nr:glycosyltransferase [Flavobacterium sp.]